MNILYINQYAGTPKTGMEFRPYYLAKEWGAMGHNVLIICSTYSHLRLNNTYNTGYNKIDGVNYLFIWGNKYKGNGISRFINILLFVLQLIILAPYIAIKHKPDHIVASSTHLLDIFPSYIISIFSKARIAFEIHDIWPLTLIEIGAMSKYHPFVGLIALAERITYKVADKVISILPDAYKHAEKFGVSKDNFIVIPNGYDFSENSSYEDMPKTLKTMMHEAKASYKNIVGYAGGIAKSNAINLIADAFKGRKDTALIIVGDGVEKSHLKNLYKSYNNVYWHPKISKSQVQDFLSEVGFAVFAVEDSPLYKYGISFNKIFDYMNSGKPIIQLSNLKNTEVELAHCGVCINLKNKINADKKLEELFKLKKKTLINMGENGLSYLKAHHNYQALAEKFAEFLVKQ